MNEIFKDIDGYNGKYQIGNYGTVLKYNKDIVPFWFFDGYVYVALSSKGKQKKYRVHRLVAQAFLPKVEGKDVINHKDENKANNYVGNLEWCTVKENCNWGTRIKRIAEANRKSIISIETGHIFNSCTETAKVLGVSKSAITNAIKRHQKCKGHYLAYVGGGL